MVAHAIKRAGQDVPWQFWNTRCFRTLKNMQAAKNVTVPRAGVHHNALHDALYQAKVVQYILNGAPAQKAVA
jgi:exodeoxyribonuclease VIII